MRNGGRKTQQGPSAKDTPLGLHLRSAHTFATRQRHPTYRPAPLDSRRPPAHPIYQVTGPDLPKSGPLPPPRVTSRLS